MPVTARYDGPRKTETDAEREAWLLDEAQVSEDELAARFEPEPDTTEFSSPDASIHLDAAQVESVGDANPHKRIGYVPPQTGSFLAKQDVRAMACASVGSRDIFSVDQFWIFDSGCGYDMMSTSKAKHLMKFVTKAELQEFNTANGQYETDEIIPLTFVMGNDSYDARPYLMENSPSVLSMGQRCMNEGFCFLWIKGFDTCVLTPSGDLVPFTVVNGVPYFES